MELAFVIWAVGVLPSLAGPVSFFGGLVVFFALGLTLYSSIVEKTGSYESDREEGKAFKEVSCKVFKWMLPIWLIACMIPDKTTSYQMLAAYGVQKVVENPQAQSLASDGVDVLKALMEKAKRELGEDMSKESTK